MTVNLKPLWDAQLCVYKEVERICRQKGIRFWAGYGTVLGAIRHGGFIPWDDDIDLIFPLPDWKRFLVEAPALLPPHLKLVTPENTTGFTFNYAKVSDIRRDVVDRIAKETGHPLSGGVNIDLFPLVGIPKRTFRHKIRAFALRCVRNKRLATKLNTLTSKVARCVGTILSPFYGHLVTETDFRVLGERLQEEISFNDARLVGIFDCGIMDFKSAAPRSCFSGERVVNFQGVKMPLPIGAEVYLQWQYGDWQTPHPPPNCAFYHARTIPQPWKYGPTMI